MKSRSVPFVAVVLSSLLLSVSAAPALVWKSSSSSSSSSSNSNLQSSEALSPWQVFDATLPLTGDSKSVIFLLGRNVDGSESLSSIFLQETQISQEFSGSADVYHSVRYVTDTNRLAKEATKARPQQNVVELSLQEFQTLTAESSSITEEAAEVEVTGMTSKAQHRSSKRARALQQANIFVVKLEASTQVNTLDNTVVQAIRDNSYDSVILTAARSVDEVKHERDMEMRQLFVQQQKAGQARSRRRLDEDQDQQNADNQQEDEEDDLSGIYYVSMTPNILAGLLFFLLFTVITYIGVTCMNMIQGQDVYVNKMPSIGREA